MQLSTPRLVLGLAFTVPLACVAAPTMAQETLPDGLANLERERSRQCVPVLARLEALESSLEPLAARSQRLMAVANAIALEDRSSVEPLDSSDPVEAEVAAWFERDLALANRYLETEDGTLVVERDQDRQAIKDRVSSALMEVQAEANATIAAAGELTTPLGGCDGAILLRPTVLEACETSESPVCDAARATEPRAPYRFVDDAADLWQVQEMRPWTSPTPLTVMPDGQLGGARTLGYARNGNLTLSLAFAPLIGAREEFTPEQLSRFQEIVDSAGFSFDHPEVAFVPALSLRASVAAPLAGETVYVLHFDGPEAADPVWTGVAGQAVEVTFPVAPRHLARLASGHPLRFTAVVEDATDAESAGEVAYSVEFTPLNQSPATSALMAYMSGQLSRDLHQLFPEGGR